MLRTDFVPRSHNAAFEKGERILHGIGVNPPLHVSFLVPNRPMLSGEVTFHGKGVGRELIGYEHFNIIGNISFDKGTQSFGGDIFGLKEPEFPAALPDSEHDLLGGFGFRHRNAVLAPSKIGFVHFHDAVQFPLLAFHHRGTNPMAEIPCGFVGNAQGPLDLIGGHAFAGFADKQNRHEPSGQRKVRILEYRTDRNAELVVACTAVQEVGVGGKPHNFLSLATGAHWTFRPAQPLKQFAASFVGRKSTADFRQSHWSFSHE